MLLSFGLTALLTFTAIISLNLAVINLLPVPALDGGRLMFVLIEAITRKQIPAVWAMRVNVGGLVVLYAFDDPSHLQRHFETAIAAVDCVVAPEIILIVQEVRLK